MINTCPSFYMIHIRISVHGNEVNHETRRLAGLEKDFCSFFSIYWHHKRPRKIARGPLSLKASEMKNAWPIRFVKYVILTIYVYFLYFIYAIVQLDLWILTKRNGPIPQAVRMLVVTFGFFFLLTAYLGIIHCI